MCAAMVRPHAPQTTTTEVTRPAPVPGPTGKAAPGLLGKELLSSIALLWTRMLTAAHCMTPLAYHWAGWGLSEATNKTPSNGPWDPQPGRRRLDLWITM